MKKKQGQAITEFAIILPLFLLFLTGIFFLCIYCYNVIALETMTRDIARAVSVNPASLEEAYEAVQADYADGRMANLMGQGYYTWNPTDGTAFPAPQQNGSEVTVTLTAASNGSYTVLPATISASVSMYKENQQ